jgi:dihydroorotase
MKITVLKAGRIIDPSQNIDQTGDLVLEGSRILGIDQATNHVDETIDCRGKIVLPGLIDTHAHIFQYVSGRFGLDPDTCGVYSGVTTLIDQGGASCITLPGFEHYIAKPSKTRVLSFISAYLVGGLEGHFYADLYRPDCCDVQATAKAIKAYPHLVKGIKAHAEIGGYERWGSAVMAIAAEIGRDTDRPVYIHLGQLWPKPSVANVPTEPDDIFNSIVSLVKRNDILAHPFSRHPGGFISQTGDLHPLVKEILASGVKVDVGHGSHFNFEIARCVLDAGIVPDTLGADMHGYNTKHATHPPGTPEIHPDEGDHIFASAVPFSLVSAMNSMMALGLDFKHVIKMVTNNAAKMVAMADEIGTLKPGSVADVTVLSDERGKWTLRDNDHNKVTAQRLLAPAFCLRAGERFDARRELIPQSLAA